MEGGWKWSLDDTSIGATYNLRGAGEEDRPWSASDGGEDAGDVAADPNVLLKSDAGVDGDFIRDGCGVARRDMLGCW